MQNGCLEILIFIGGIALERLSLEMIGTDLKKFKNIINCINYLHIKIVFKIFLS